MHQQSSNILGNMILVVISLFIVAAGSKYVFEDMYITADPQIDALYINGMMFPPEILKYNDKWYLADIIPILTHTWSIAVKISKDNSILSSLNFLDKNGLMTWSRSGAFSTNAERWRCKGTYPGHNWFGNISISMWPNPQVVGLNLKTLNRLVNRWPRQVENMFFKAYWVWPSIVDAEGAAYCVLSIDPKIYETPLDPTMFGMNPSLLVFLFFVFVGMILIISFKIAAYLRYKRKRIEFAKLLTQERDKKVAG